jgi:hypothetical protein
MWKRLTAIANALEADAASFSSIRRVARSRSFMELVKAGSSATVVALERLSGDRRPLWLYFLQFTTQARPAAGQDTVDGAANAWRAWGFQAGLL